MLRWMMSRSRSGFQVSLWGRGERLTLGGGVLDGLDEEHVEVIAAGDLFLDAEDGGLELL